MSRVCHVVSVSGGKDSTALYLLALERMNAKGRPFRAVFADTGNEHQAVYDAVRALSIKTGGPVVEWVSANFDRQIANKREVVNTKWRREGVSSEVIDAALEMLHPTGNPFLDLCIWKGRFPSSQARFCTEELKVKPIQREVYKPLLNDRKTIVSWQGVRADESIARSLLPKWQRISPDIGRIYAYRPLLLWTVADVWQMHKRHGMARNPLYEQGMERVGCMPCIMVKKSELREIANRFPDHVARIERWERIVSQTSKRCATFFAAVLDPMYVGGEDITHEKYGIRNRVEWSRTARGGRQYDLTLSSEFSTACNQWGACE